MAGDAKLPPQQYFPAQPAGFATHPRMVYPVDRSFQAVGYPVSGRVGDDTPWPYQQPFDQPSRVTGPALAGFTYTQPLHCRGDIGQDAEWPFPVPAAPRAVIWTTNEPIRIASYDRDQWQPSQPFPGIVARDTAFNFGQPVGFAARDPAFNFGQPVGFTAHRLGIFGGVPVEPVEDAGFPLAGVNGGLRQLQADPRQHKF
jgi:hypothetical protein